MSPLLAYRTWEADRGWLASPVMNDAWPTDGSFTASRCGNCSVRLRRDFPNRERCSCGIYSFIDPVECVWQDHWYLRSGRHVMGSVSIWGRTVPHVRGYRSLYARLTALYLWPDPPAKTVETCLRYPVPILQAALQPWWTDEFLEGRAPGKSWTAKQREEGTE